MCPWCASAAARSQYDGSDCCFNLLCIGVCLSRNIIREGYNIEVGLIGLLLPDVMIIQGECCEDLLTMLCCPCCAVAQLQNEVW